MNKSKGKITATSPKMRLQRIRIKSATPFRVKKQKGAPCVTLPFVNSLSRKNAFAARIFKDSYARGVAAASSNIADIEDLF